VPYKGAAQCFLLEDPFLTATPRCAFFGGGASPDALAFASLRSSRDVLTLWPSARIRFLYQLTLAIDVLASGNSRLMASKTSSLVLPARSSRSATRPMVSLCSSLIVCSRLAT